MKKKTIHMFGGARLRIPLDTASTPRSKKARTVRGKDLFLKNSHVQLGAHGPVNIEQHVRRTKNFSRWKCVGHTRHKNSQERAQVVFMCLASKSSTVTSACNTFRQWGQNGCCSCFQHNTDSHHKFRRVDNTWIKNCIRMSVERGVQKDEHKTWGEITGCLRVKCNTVCGRSRSLSAAQSVAHCLERTVSLCATPRSFLG